MSASSSAPAAQGIRRVTSAIGSSAEYAIAAALFAVCLLAGGAGLYLKWTESGPDTSAVAKTALQLEPSTADTQAAEQAALDEAQRELRSELAGLDRKRSQADNADRDRERALQRQLAEVERQRAAATQRTTQERTAPAAAKAAPAIVASAPVSVAAPAVRTAAAVDWATCTPPRYPRAAQRRGDEGVVLMSFSVSAEGRAIDKRVMSSSGSKQLDEAALEAIGKCRFTPATSDNKPIAGDVEVKFAWKLGT